MIVSFGDVVDCGGVFVVVIDWLMLFVLKGYKCFVLCGNYEDMMIKFMFDFDVN